MKKTDIYEVHSCYARHSVSKRKGIFLYSLGIFLVLLMLISEYIALFIFDFRLSEYIMPSGLEFFPFDFVGHIMDGILPVLVFLLYVVWCVFFMICFY